MENATRICDRHGDAVRCVDFCSDFMQLHIVICGWSMLAFYCTGWRSQPRYSKSEGSEEQWGCAKNQTEWRDWIPLHSKAVEWNLKISKENELDEFLWFVRRLVNDFSKIYEIIITGYYLWSISTIGCSLFFVHFGTVEWNAFLVLKFHNISIS